MTQTQINLILDYIEALDNLLELIQQGPGWIISNQWTLFQTAEYAILDAGLKNKAGIKFGNVWD